MSGFWSLLGSLITPRGAPRLVRRVRMHCPHDERLVEVDLLTSRTGVPEVVLRCSAHASCPPACDQSCRRCAEAVLTRPRAVIVYPPGTGALEDHD